MMIKNKKQQDFFRDALEASLEASSRSRTRSAPQPSIFRDYKVELNFRLPMVNEENQTCEESSSSSSPSPCLNCVRLQRRIVELQEKLSRITEEEEDTEASPVSNRLPPDQVLQSPETVHMEEAEPAWMEPLSPPQGDLHEEDQDVDLPASPAVSQDTSPKQLKLKRTPRFQKSWLKIFWFLRYSQTLDHMWCHVCRLHADNSHQNLSLIKGSKMFKIHNIKKHSYSKYHRENLERYMLHV